MSVTLRSSVEAKDVNHIYYNATLTNTTTAPIEATIIDTRSVPILGTPENYEMSVIRFDVAAQTIPLTIVDVVSPAFVNPATPGTLPTQFLYTTLTVAGVDNTANVVLTPAASTVQFPLGSVFNFQKLLDDVNAAFAASYAAIAVKPAGSAAPQLVWNPQTQLIDLYVDGNYVFVNSAPPFVQPAIQIWVRFALWEYLTGFNSLQNGQYRADRKDVQIEVRPTTALVLPAFGARAGFPASVAVVNLPLFEVQQEAQQTQNWNSARSLIITSSLLPTRPEYVPTSATSSNNSVSTASQRIVSDFLIPEDQNLMTGRNVFQYLPTAQYRWVDLYSRSPFSVIDLTMQWADFSGNLYPVVLNPGAALSVKVLFRRRGYCDCSKG